MKKIVLIIFLLLAAFHATASETPVIPTPEQLAKIRAILKRPYKVIRGETITGDLIGENPQYTVKYGDTLFKLAKRFDVSFMAITRTNNIKNPGKIRIGNTFIIPKQTIVPKNLTKGILINIPEYRLYLFEENQVIDIYPVAIGLTTWKTLCGKFKIRNKAINPSWQMPEEMAERMLVPREIIPPGDTNPLGDRWIGLSLPGTGIHGTIDPLSIGQASSHGCIRLYPDDIHRLFPLVEKGEEGEIIYEPIKIAFIGHKIYIEVHRDIYKIIKNQKDETMRRLDYLGLTPYVDMIKLELALKERLGIPILVSPDNDTESLP